MFCRAPIIVADTGRGKSSYLRWSIVAFRSPRCQREPFRWQLFLRHGHLQRRFQILHSMRNHLRKIKSLIGRIKGGPGEEVSVVVFRRCEPLGRHTSAVISSTCPVTFVVSSVEFVSTSSFENTIDKVALVHIAVCKIEYSFPCIVLSSFQTMICVAARWDCHEELTLTLVLVEVALVLVPVPPTIHSRSMSGVVYKFTFVIVAIWILPSSYSCPKQKKGGKVTEMTNVCVSYATSFHRGFTTLTMPSSTFPIAFVLPTIFVNHFSVSVG